MTMVLLKSAVCLFLCVIVTCLGDSEQSPKKNEVEGYFWRDYAGFIPHDAFPGGREKGIVTYIGQVLYNNLLIPAKIYPDDERGYFEWGLQEHTTTENIKILCSDNFKQLRWLSTSDSEFKIIKSKRFVTGGYENGLKIYVGRKSRNGEMLVGKVVANENDANFHSTQDGKSVESSSFDVLYFDDPRSEAAINTEGYYWRDYAGVVPPDALPGGSEDDSTTYIAQVLYNSLLVPGKLNKKEKKAEFEWGLQAHTTTEDIKIFCTDKPDRFHWLKTNSDEFRKIKDKHLVVVSREGNGVLYVSRVKIGGDKVVGKLLVNDHVFYHGAYKDKSVQAREFEVLYYEPPADEAAAVL